MSMKLLILAAVVLCSACENSIPDVNIPAPLQPDPLLGAQPLTQAMKTRMEGVYSVQRGSEDFGKSIVIQWNGNYCAFYAGKNAAYCIMQGGYTDSELVFTGYWRFAQTEYTGSITCSISGEEGAGYIQRGNDSASGIVIRGLFGDGGKLPWKPFVLEYSRAVVRSREDFLIIGHRGGGRNIDRLPVSENSVEMIKHSERLGVNGIEIDVQCTKDGIPVLCHDKYLSTRLVNEDYMTGKISDYTLAQLKTLCMLKNGERIPTLREALETAIDSTRHRLVWLDIKANGIVGQVAAVQREYIRIAAEKGRIIDIVMGLAEEATYTEYMRMPESERPPALCEFDEPRVVESNAVIWAPRWSRGLLNDRIAAMKSRGVRVFTWTVDMEGLIKTFLDESSPDGMLSNYPAMVAYEYYTR